jgi:glyceraldehyde 3-phosphate dehydrogenase
MKKIRVGLNGFGRIGRAFVRIASAKDTFDIVQINTRKTPPKTLAYLLKYDSVYRRFAKKVESGEDSISIDGKKIAVTQSPEPQNIPWEQNQVDVVVDATGAFKTSAELQKHIRGSVKKVLITVDSEEEEIPHIVLGVNDTSVDFSGKHILSNCTCTTNCAAILFKVLHDNFKVLSGFLTTTHAYTQTQSLLDDSGKTPDRSRAAALNIVPTTTGASRAVVKTIPELKGKIQGVALRVPVPTVSITVVSAIVEKTPTVEQINEAFKKASESNMKEVLGYETEVLVSSDYIGSPFSCIFDANYTKVSNGHQVNVFGWYDNEWGYSTRLVELVEKLSDHV